MKVLQRCNFSHFSTRLLCTYMEMFRNRSGCRLCCTGPTDNVHIQCLANLIHQTLYTRFRPHKVLAHEEYKCWLGSMFRGKNLVCSRNKSFPLFCWNSLTSLGPLDNSSKSMASIVLRPVLKIGPAGNRCIRRMEARDL